MITIQIPGPLQEAALKQFISEHGLSVAGGTLSGQEMVLLEDDMVLGYAAYRQKGDEAVLVMLFVAPAVRKMGFGDGLFRGTVNLMERNGIGKFYAPVHENLTGFLKAEELILCGEGPAWIENIFSTDRWFEGSLPEFFQKPCKGGRHL